LSPAWYGLKCEKPEDASWTILFDELIDHPVEVWIACAEAPRQPVSTTLGNFVAVGYHIELARLARGTDSINV
jgi:hypothetical protein